MCVLMVTVAGLTGGRRFVFMQQQQPDSSADDANASKAQRSSKHTGLKRSRSAGSPLVSSAAGKAKRSKSGSSGGLSLFQCLSKNRFNKKGRKAG